MNREKKSLTAHEKIEMDLMAEAELVKLQRQYRIMEGDRKAFSEETNIQLAKQKRLIDSLIKEKENLLTDLKIAACKFNKRKDKVVTEHLNVLLDEHDNFDTIIEKQSSHLHEINVQIQKLEKQLSNLRGNQVTDLHFEAKVHGGEKIIKTLENQLETEVKRFCSILTINKAIREEINHLIKERTQFNIVWENLLHDLDHGKKVILDLIEQATIAFDQREEWCSKLRALRIRNQNDLILHTQEMKELQRKIDHDHKLYDFLGAKSQKRVMRDLEDKEIKKKELQKEQAEQRFDKYQNMLKEIQQLVNEEDIDKLRAQYFKREEENFALFNYVNELNHEIEVTTSEIEHLVKEIENQKHLKEIRDQQQKETIDILTTELDTSIAEAKEAEANLDEANLKLKQFLKGIQELFDLIKCDNTPILQLLGTETTIDNHNTLVYLGVLEKKVVELTSNMYLKEKALATKRRKHK